MAPQLHLAVHVTCHLTAAVILSVQQRGPSAILLFCVTTMQIICCSCTTLPTRDNMVYAPHAQIPTFMRAGISKSANLTDRDEASECPSPLIFYMNIKQFSVTVKAEYDL